MEERYMEGVSQFLSCRKGDSSFKFLGIPVGANPRLLSTWQLVIDSIKARLNSWKSRQLSIGGRVTLINSVLASLPLYLFSFYKAPKKVIDEIVKLQRRFLWGGVGEERKMAWVSWETICKPKEKGGLGIKNLEVFNIALLTKWRWRILVDEGNPLWKRIVVSRYGLKGRWPSANEYRRGWGKTSLWWRDLCQLGEGTNLENGWFDEVVKLKLRRGNIVRFWSDKWLGRDRIADIFPSVYSACCNKEAVVEEMGTWVGGRWHWEWSWVSELQLPEQQLAAQLQELLLSVELAENSADSYTWLLNSLQGFTVKQCYSWLSDNVAGVGSLADNILRVIWPKIWRNDVPSKVLIFAWRVMHNKIATRDALFRRGVIRSEEEKRCAFCSDEDESTLHLFLHCQVTKMVWQQVFNWLDGAILGEEDLPSHFMAFGKLIKGKKQKRLKHLIWLAVMWNIWLTRNKVIFKGEGVSIPCMVSAIKDCAWGWFKARQGRASRMEWSDWFSCPLGVLSSL